MKKYYSREPIKGYNDKPVSLSLNLDLIKTLKATVPPFFMDDKFLITYRDDGMEELRTYSVKKDSFEKNLFFSKSPAIKLVYNNIFFTLSGKKNYILDEKGELITLGFELKKFIQLRLINDLIIGSNRDECYGLDLSTKKYLWQKPAKNRGDWADFVSDGNLIIGSNVSHTKKYCIHPRTGEILWDVKVSDLPFDAKSLGRNYIIENLVIGVTNDRRWFALNIETGTLVWDKKLPPESSAFGIYADNYIYQVGSEWDGETSRITYYILNGLTGELVKEMDISEECSKAGMHINVRWDFFSGLIGMAISDTHIFMLHKYTNRLLAMNKETGVFEWEYRHPTDELSFFSLHDKRLYIGDDSSNLLIFGEENLETTDGL